MKYLLIFLVVLVIFIISVTLGAHNDQVITFNYLLAQGQFSISTLLASLFGVGFLLGWAICGLFWLRVRVSLANAQRKVKRMQAQIEQGSTTVTTTSSSAARE
ncbi:MULTISPECIES: LapA family protein [Pantoea]|uniref:LapA family protein n=1 Tax=Pantoea TaxID=53335 RepID=UPI001C060A86|nr:LapA family protein [Pantoea bituminis]